MKGRDTILVIRFNKKIYFYVEVPDGDHIRHQGVALNDWWQLAFGRCQITRRDLVEEIRQCC